MVGVRTRGVNMKKWIAIGLIVLIVAIGGFAVTKKVSPISWGWWGDINTSSGLALAGYDPVAYFDAGKPMPGDSQFSYKWGGAIWQFSNARNREKFVQSPELYAPQFGGFCSFAAGKGVTAVISPDAWHIDSGNLYLFADTNVRKEWVDGIDEGSIKASADNWSKR